MNASEFTTRLGARRSGEGWSARCPAHDDAVSSLTIGEGDDGRVLVTCHAGCETAAIMSALGLGLADLFPAKANGHDPIVETYDYVDEQSRPLFQVCRTAGKRFLQRHADPQSGEWIWNTKGIQRALYRLPLVLSAVKAGHTVYVAEGERDVHALEDAGVVATSNPGGAGKWRTDYGKPLRGANVVVISDKDEPGRKHAEHVRASLTGIAASVRVVEARSGKDAADHLAAGHSVSDLVEVRRLVSPSNSVSTSTTPLTKREPKLIDLRGIKPRNIEWLIRDRLALDMLTLLVGHGGAGKGVCWVNWVARISRGELGERRFVLISAPEDVYETMLVPRLIAAGADLEYVRGIDTLQFPEDEAWIEQQIRERKAALVVADPVLTHLSAKTDSYRDHDVKLALTPLLQIAGRTRCAVLGVVHFTKNTERGAFLSIQASGAFGNTARHVLGMVDSNDDPDMRVLGVVKTNIARKGLSWRMRVQMVPIDGLDDPVPTLVEDGDSDVSVDDVLSQRPSRAGVPPAKLQELVLRELQGGEKTRAHLNQAAADELQAIADQTYRHGLQPLNNKQIRFRKDASGVAYWRLAGEETTWSAEQFA